MGLLCLNTKSKWQSDQSDHKRRRESVSFVSEDHMRVWRIKLQRLMYSIWSQTHDSPMCFILKKQMKVWCWVWESGHKERKSDVSD